MNGAADFALVAGVALAMALSLYALYAERRTGSVVEPIVEPAIDCKAEIELLQGDVDSMRDEIGRLRAELEWVTAAVRILSAQLKSAGIEPAVNIDDRKPVDVNTLSMAGLRRKMARAFTVEGVEALAFDLGLDGGDIAGETKDARVIALIEAVNQRGRVAELLLLLEKERPHVKWIS